ncbi:nickel-responsive transcriptional regulator NikR [Pyrinomonas methylaliphatogenes]|uniref:Putative nickel-responsive regulator n=1 Tax=Pyrinomonas methylaliphatogenes TaxID=454194 RepID=A0A0B6X095_9BACT|nr:nickel-responsive transcriptional regulator NikR [Pyrinomonas methylaliphatogenes]MBX5480002.1 nickel-responsive transcriptional regulator NikR [Pyrinomonas methylaliphatogenes]CDM65830.1 transcriptional regulator, CopG family [Pyrinomonas methylaliphatogenes]
MGELVRFSVSVEDDLLESFDRLIERQGYGNRSEALRDLMRDALVRAHLDERPKAADVLGTLTIVYDHHATDLADRLTALQHDHYRLIISVLHVHISHDDCMEVIVLRGPARRVRALADALISIKGVKHGRLFLTIPAKKITDRRK